MKYIHLYALLLMLAFSTSCRQPQTKVPKAMLNTETKDSISAFGPTTMVRNVKQGRKGTLLIAASFGGVFRYDPRMRNGQGAFTKLTGKTGPRRFWNVLEDRRGNLWVATTDSGLYYYPSAKPGKDHSSISGGHAGFQHFTTRDGLASNIVSCMYEDKSGVLWIGTGNGISLYDGKSFKNLTTKDGLSGNDVNAIVEDKTGQFWVGTRGDAYIYDPRHHDNPGNIFSIPMQAGKAFKNVRSIIKDHKGNIWLGGSDGLWRYDGHNFKNFTRKFVGCVYEDKKWNIWTTGSLNPNGVGAGSFPGTTKSLCTMKNPV